MLLSRIEQYNTICQIFKIAAAEEKARELRALDIANHPYNTRDLPNDGLRRVFAQIVEWAIPGMVTQKVPSVYGPLTEMVGLDLLKVRTEIKKFPDGYKIPVRYYSRTGKDLDFPNQVPAQESSLVPVGA
jgi:hypothetical protein